jgi:hypothetical protein
LNSLTINKVVDNRREESIKVIPKHYKASIAISNMSEEDDLAVFIYKSIEMDEHPTIG